MHMNKNNLTLCCLLSLWLGHVLASDVSFGPETILNDQINNSGTIALSNMIALDVDGDGDQDIVIAQYGTDDELVWLENDGSGLSNYTKNTISTTVNGVVNISSGDMDLDGDIDLVVADKQNDALYWYQNDGVGSFTETVIDSGSGIESSREVALADFDADGDIDVALAATLVSKLYWYENSSSGSTWTQHDTGITPADGISSISTGDYDLDGSQDILIGTRSGTPAVQIIRNTAADGSVWSTIDVDSTGGTTLAEVQFADLDLDGRAEVYSHAGNDNLLQWIPDFMGNFSSSITVVSGAVQGAIKFVDLDLDSDLDIVIGRGTGGDFSWFENTAGDGSTWSEHILESNLADKIYGSLAVDLDQDGDLDLVYGKDEDGVVYSRENLQFHSAPLVDTFQAIDSSFTDVSYFVYGKFDGDQFDDIVAADSTSTGVTIKVYAGDGAGNFTFAETIASVSSSTDSNLLALAKADIDNDGDLDVLFTTDGTDSLYLIENALGGPFQSTKVSRGANWITATALATGFGASSVLEVADFNNDGLMDIAVVDDVAGEISWFDNAGGWSENLVSSGANNSRDMKVGDFNSDGRPDILYSEGAQSVHWFSNDSNDGLTWSEHNTAGLILYRLAIADIDHDGDLDFSGSRKADNTIRWAENVDNGTSWISHDTTILPHDADTDSARRFIVEDFDHDGDEDFLMIHGNGQLTLLESLDLEVDSWSRHDVLTGIANPLSLAVFDMDLNGQFDLLSNGTTNDEFGTIINQGGQFSVTGGGAAAQSSEEQQTVSLISFTATHNGRVADGDMELATLDLQFVADTGVCGSPLMTSAKLNPLVSNISLYLDDGSGSFEPFSDTLIFSELGPFTLNLGALTLTLPDQDSSLRISPEGSKNYFITLRYRVNASTQSCNALSLFLDTENEETTTGQDRDSGIVLTRSYFPNPGSGVQTIVANTNSAPTTTGISSQNIDEDSVASIDISGSFSDPDGDTLAFVFGGLPPSLSFNSSTGAVEGTPTQIDVNNSPFTVNVVARDPQGETANTSFQLTVNNVNDAPIVQIPRGDFNINQNISYNSPFNPNFFDEDNDTLVFSATGLPAGLTMAPNGILSGIISNQDWLDGPDYAVTVTAQDPSGETAQDSFTITIINVNDQPVFSGPIPPQTANSLILYSFDASGFFSDPDGDSLTYTQTGLPASLSINSAGQISGTPTFADAVASPYFVRIIAIDPDTLFVTSNDFQLRVIDSTGELIFANSME